MIKVNLYTAKGTKKGDFMLPKEYEEKENNGLLSQALYVYRDRSYLGSSKVKTRSEVIASTRKIYRQKGTGGARHGDVKAPIFVGGGKAHGPKGFKRVLGLPKKMRRKALNLALNLKSQEKKLIVVESFKTISKTKDADNLLKSLYKKEIGDKRFKNVLVAISETNSETSKYFQNLAEVKIIPFRNLNVLDVYYPSLLIIEKEAFGEADKLNKTTGESKTAKTVKTITKQSKKVNKVKK